MSRSLRVGIDLDGVVYRWTDTARYLLNAHRGYSLGESTSWYYIPQHVSAEDWGWLWAEGVRRYGLFRHGNVYPGSFDALIEIARVARLVIITGRPRAAARDTVAWLGFHNVPLDELHIVGDRLKSTVEPPCHLYVDDNPENCADLAENRPGSRVLLIDRPWNHDRPVGGGIRVDGWPQVLWHLNDLRQGRCATSA